MRRLRAAALLVAASVLLAGCATIPTQGVVQTAGPVTAPDDASLVYIPAGPADGAKPEDIVRGFVQASGAGRDFRVAREFLTEDLARTWRPSARVLVHDDPWKPETDGDSVVLRVPVTARVNPRGTYVPEPQARQVAVPFRLVRVRGQWRIDAMQDGVVLTQAAFRRVSPVALQYFDPSYRRFVPDLRWFVGGGTPSVVVTELLAGRSALLAGPVAASAFPAGSRLAGPVVTRDGVTTVSVTTEGATPDARAVQRMQQQLARTLAPASVRLVVDGTTAPTPTGAGPEAQPSYQSPVVQAGGRFGTLTEAGLRQDAVFGSRVAALRPRAVTVSPRQGIAAVLTGDQQVARLGRTGAARVLDRRAGLVPPALDQAGWTYSVPETDPDALIAIPPSGRQRSLPTGLAGTLVIAIEVSPDGTRLLALVQTDRGPAAYVAGIERDASGAPTDLTGAVFPLSIASDSAVDATWVDSGTVAVLTGSGDLQTVTTQQVGGIAQRLVPLQQSARSIVAAATGQGGVRALLDTGDLLVRPANASTIVWQQEFSGSVDVDLVAVQR